MFSHSPFFPLSAMVCRIVSVPRKQSSGAESCNALLWREHIRARLNQDEIQIRLDRNKFRASSEQGVKGLLSNEGRAYWHRLETRVAG
jgi:hypothetical protein